MLSMILSHANSNETSFTGLKDVSIFQLRVEMGLLPVDTNPCLLDKPARVAPALGKSRLEKRCHQVCRVVGNELGDFSWNFALAKLHIEIGLCRLSRVLTV